MAGKNTSTTTDQTSKKLFIKDLNTLYPPLTLIDLKKFKPQPKNFFMGDGFIRRGAGTLLIGSTGHGKSVLVEHMAVCMATGTNFFDIKVKRPFRVLLICAENDIWVLKRDVLSIVKYLKVDEKIVQENLVMRYVSGIPSGMFHLWLEQAVTEAKPDIIILDPYQKLVGAVDLNRTDSFLSWITPIDMMVMRKKLGLLVVAHSTKPKDREKWTSREMVYMLTGTSAMSNWARTSCELLALDNDIRFKLHFSKSAERTGLTANGKTIREIYIQQSGDAHQPYWEKSSLQHAPIKIDVGAEVARCLRKNPNWTQEEVAKHLRKSKSTIKPYWPKDRRRGGKNDKKKTRSRNK